MKRRVPLLLVLWAAIGLSAQAAGSGGVTTLHQCIVECLGKNPSMAAQRLLLAADKEGIWKARSGLLPELTGSAEIAGLSGSPSGYWALLGINDPDITGQVTRGGRLSTSHGPFRIAWGAVGTGQVKLEYPIYANGSILGLNNAPAVASAKAAYDRQTWTIRLTEQDVIASLVGAFFHTTAYERKVELDQQVVALAEKRVEIEEEELRLNLILPQVVELAKQELQAKKQSLMTSEQWAADSEKMLLEYLGRTSRQKLNLDKTEPRIPALPPLDGFLDKVSAAHPVIAIQKANIVEAQQAYRLAQVALFPSVNLETSYSGGTGFGPFPLDQFFAGVGVQVPIFDFGHKLSAEHEKLDQLKAAQVQLDQVRLTLREAILAQIDQIHTLEATLAQLQEAYVSANTNLALIQSEHDQGITTQLALTDAQIGLVEANDNLLLYRLAEWIDYAQLQRLTGGVWVWNR